MRKLLFFLMITLALAGGGCLAGQSQKLQGGNPNQTPKNSAGGSKSSGNKQNNSVNPSGNKGQEGQGNNPTQNDSPTANPSNKEAGNTDIEAVETSFDSGSYPRIYGDVVWSPGGKRFAYIADEPGGKLGVYITQVGISGKGQKIKEFAYDTKFGSPFVSLGWSANEGTMHYLFSSYQGSEYKPVFKFGKIDLTTGKDKAFRMKDISILSGTVNWALGSGFVTFWGDGGIQRVELASGKMTRLVRVESRDSLFTVDASPDGTKLAYTRIFGYRSVSQEKVFVLDVITGKENLVSPAGQYCWRPKWFSDGEKLGFLTSSYLSKGFEIVQGEAGPLTYSEGVGIVKSNGELVRNLQFKGEHIVGFSPLASQQDQVEVYTGRKVQVTEQGGISFILDTHRIMELAKGQIIWEKKFPKVQSGENNGVLWVDEDTWVNTVSVTNSTTKTLILKTLGDKELAKVDDVVDNIFVTATGLVFARQGKTGQDLWFLSKDGLLSQLTKTNTTKLISGVNNGKVVFLENSSDGSTQKLIILRLELAENTIAN
ncbi:MAG: TolB family protein [Carboxydocellales bacterium]